MSSETGPRAPVRRALGLVHAPARRRTASQARDTPNSFQDGTETQTPTKISREPRLHTIMRVVFLHWTEWLSDPTRTSPSDHLSGRPGRRFLREIIISTQTGLCSRRPAARRESQTSLTGLQSGGPPSGIRASIRSSAALTGARRTG